MKWRVTTQDHTIFRVERKNKLGFWTPYDTGGFKIYATHSQELAQRYIADVLEKEAQRDLPWKQVWP